MEFGRRRYYHPAIRHLGHFLFLLTATASSVAHAGNLQPPLVGREAVVTGGAVVATVSDAGAAWFNPAGLSTILQSSVDISADAFVLRHYDIPDLFQTVLPDGRTSLDVSHTEFLALPAALVFARKLQDGLTLSVSLFTRAQPFVRNSDDLWARAGLSTTGSLREGGGYAFEENLTLIQNSSIYHAGPSIGWQVSDELRLGFSVFGIYQNDRGSFQYWTSFESADTNERTLLMEQQEFDLRAVGGQLLFGAQWRFLPQWKIGMTFRSPSLVITHWLDTSVVVARSRIDPNDATSSFFHLLADRAGDNGTLVQPARFTVGVAFDYGTGYVALEGDVSPSFRNRSWRFDRAPTWNGRIGARHAISKTFAIGGGLFTDRTSARKPGGFIESEIDSYGIAAGIEYSTPYEILDDGSPGSILFSTTLGIRYALGLGDVGGVVLDPRFLTTPTGTFSSVVFHEVDLHLASSVQF